MENNLDDLSKKVLRELYDKSTGLTFDELNKKFHFDDKTFLYLINNEFISEPEGQIFPVNGSTMCKHEGKIIIEKKGKAFVEYDKEYHKKYKIENIKYIITTVIAVFALVLSIISLIK